MSPLYGFLAFVGSMLLLGCVIFATIIWLTEDMPPWHWMTRPVGTAPLDDAKEKWVCSFGGKQIWFVVRHNGLSQDPMWADTGMKVPGYVERRIDNELKRIREKECAAERQKDFMSGLV